MTKSKREPRPIPDPFTPKVRTWDVQVIESNGVCRTVFSVGVRHFTLAEGTTADRDHCEFIRTMFIRALMARDELLAKQAASPNDGHYYTENVLGVAPDGTPTPEMFRPELLMQAYQITNQAVFDSKNDNLTVKELRADIDQRRYEAVRTQHLSWCKGYHEGPCGLLEAQKGPPKP